MRSKIVENDNILVSICCLAYNHEAFIKQAIEGFLMQEVEFPIEIIIHDDASTDDTASIIKEYEKKYPEIIKPIYQQENQYSKGIRPSPNYVWPRARGKYIALCEGDDYWTDPLKLQKQVDFMEKHNNCSLCFHPTKIIYENNKRENRIVHEYNNLQPTIFQAIDLLSGKINGWTASLFFRSEVVRSLPKCFNNVPYGDAALKMLCAVQGNIGYLGGNAMCVYRRGAEGAWSGREGKSREWEEKRLLSHLQLIDYFNEYTNHQFEESLKIKKSKHIFTYLLAVQNYCSKMEAAALIANYSDVVFSKPKKFLRLCLRFILGKKGYRYFFQ